MNRELATAVVAFIGDPTVGKSEELAQFRLWHWRSTMHWLITSGLAVSLLHALSRLGSEHVLPPVICRRLCALDHASVARTADLRSDFLRLVAAFRETQVPFACWKGFALEPDFCHDIRVRPQMDFDFIIFKEGLSAFDHVLRAHGYTRTGLEEREATYETIPGRHYSLDHVYFPKPHRKVELHFGRDHSSRCSVGMDLDACLGRTRTGPINSSAIPALSPEDAFLTHAAHAGRHALQGWVRLGWLLELDNFIQRHNGNEELWKHVENLVGQDPQANRTGAVALRLLATVFHKQVPGVLNWAREVLPPSAEHWIEAHGHQLAIADFPGTKLHLLLQRELLTDSDWRQFEKKSLYGARKIPRVSQASPRATIPEKTLASLIQLRFIMRRLRFHCVENVRYHLAKRTFSRGSQSRNQSASSVST